MPASEFITHKTFWDAWKWGIGDDIAAVGISHAMYKDTGKSPPENYWIWKEIAFEGSGQKTIRITTAMTTKVAQGFVALGNALTNLSH